MPKSTPKSASLAFLPALERAIANHHRAESSFRQGAIYAALSGLDFAHAKLAAGHGNWETVFAEHVGNRLPLRTAQHYMQVAEGLKIKARRAADGEITFAPPKADLDAFLAKRQDRKWAHRLVQLTGHFERRYSREVWALLQSPPHRLSDAQRTRLAAAVESIADGETMASLIEAYRLTKKPTGSASTGGYRPDAAKLAEFLGAYHPALVGTDYAHLPADVQAHFRKWVAQREADPGQMAFDFCRPVFDTFEHPDFQSQVDKIPKAEAARLLDHAESLVRHLKDRLRGTTLKAA